MCTYGDTKTLFIILCVRTPGLGVLLRWLGHAPSAALYCADEAQLG